MVLATSRLTTVTSTQLPPTQSSTMSLSPSPPSPSPSSPSSPSSSLSTTTLLSTTVTTTTTTRRSTTTTTKSTTTTTTKKQATKKKEDDDDNNDDDDKDDDENNDEKNDESKNAEPESEEPEVPLEEEEDIVAAAGIPGGAVGGMAVGGAAAAVVAKKMMKKDDEEDEDDNEDDDDDDDDDEDGNTDDVDDDVGPDVVDDAVQTSQTSLQKNYDNLPQDELIETINDLYFRPPSLVSESSSHSAADSTGHLEESDNSDDLEKNVGMPTSLRSLAALSATESTFQLKRSLSRLGGSSLLDECQPLLSKSSPFLNQESFFDGFMLPIPVSLSSPHIGADGQASDGGESILSQSLTFEQEGSPEKTSTPLLPVTDDIQFVDETESLLGNQEPDERQTSSPKLDGFFTPVVDEPVACEKMPPLIENLPQLCMPSLQDTEAPLFKEESPILHELLPDLNTYPKLPHNLKKDMPLNKDLPDEEDSWIPSSK
ncbi:PREDICTED: endochitinase A-like [Branchiostoma belcheri]|uniref:Endochitinase A-like n=1 Tax=Branchiostoma belcheri TaxID=7741 RepID=A0A6P5A1P3_BRABE|nr:PREDICTED: endochitinase A-like [Branchiostoma belcheri]